MHWQVKDFSTLNDNGRCISTTESWQNVSIYIVNVVQYVIS